MLDDSSNTGVLVQTKVFPMAFLLLFFPTNITIDETTVTARWGSSFHPLEPGRHRVSVGFRYLFGQNMGENGVAIDVVHGQTVHVKYRSPFVVFGAGSIAVESDRK